MRIKFYYFKNINIKNTLSFVPFGLLCLSSLCRPVNKLTVRPIALIHTPCGVQTPAAINIDKIVADLILCTLYTFLFLFIAFG